MPINNPSAYAEGNPRGFVPDAHLHFRALPLDQQMSLLSHFTGTTNRSALTYAANMARNDPHMANRIMETYSTGADTTQMVDNHIGGTGVHNPQGAAQMGAGANALGGTGTGGAAPNAGGDGSAGGGGTVQPQPSATGAPVLPDAAAAAAAQQQAPGVGAPVGQDVSDDTSQGVSLVDLLLATGAGGAAGYGLGKYMSGGGAGAQGGAGAVPGRGQGPIDLGVATSERVPSGPGLPEPAPNVTEQGISQQIDLNDRMANAGQLPAPDQPSQARLPASDPSIPEPPAAVIGDYVVNSDGSVTSSRGGQLPRDAALKVLAVLQEYLNAGGKDDGILAPLRQTQGPGGETYIDEQRLMQAFERADMRFDPSRIRTPDQNTPQGIKNRVIGRGLSGTL